MHLNSKNQHDQMILAHRNTNKFNAEHAMAKIKTSVIKLIHDLPTKVGRIATTAITNMDKIILGYVNDLNLSLTI
jgi:hypothetical protein